MKKRVFCLLLAVVLLLGVVTVVAAAGEGGLQFRDLRYDAETDLFYVHPDAPILAFANTSPGVVGMSRSVRLYYNGTALDCNKGELSSGNPDIVNVIKCNGAMTKEGEAYFDLVLVGAGTTTLTYQNVETAQVYTATVTVSLPDGLYAAQEMTAANLLESGFCVGDYEYVWFLTAEGLTEEQADNTVVTAKQDGETDFPITVEKVRRQGTTDRYDLKIWVDTTYGVPHGWVDYAVQLPENPWASYFYGRFDRTQQAGWISGEEQYMIFFGNNPNNAGATTMQSDGTRISSIYGSSDEMRRTLVPGAYVWSDLNNSYVETENIKLKPVRIWIDAAPYFGKPDFLSLAAGEIRVAELSGENLPSIMPDNAFRINVYGLEGYQSTGNICTEIEVVEIGNNKSEKSLGNVTIKAPYRGRIMMANNFDAPQTTEELNRLLQAIANNARPGNEYTVNLAATAYAGTIVIPEKFFEQGHRLFIVGQEGTEVEHINLNGAYLYGLKNVDFRASAQNPGTALYGGYCLSLEDCKFLGYDVACDSTEAGYITPFNCLFVKNKVALKVDIAKAKSNLNHSGGNNNQFVDNEIAVLVKSLHEKNGLNAYLFRMEECNFINNGHDFDIQAPGRFYFYRNFYGKWHKDANYAELPDALYLEKNEKILNYTAPSIKGQDNDTKIYTDFRWKYPVESTLLNHADIGSFVAPVARSVTGGSEETLKRYTNYLTADWLTDAAILNEKANDLVVGADVIEAAAGKQVAVLDTQEQTLGTWTFE